MGLRLEVGEEAGPLGVVLRGHIQVGAAGPKASAKATRTLSTQGECEGTSPSLPRVAEVQSAPTYSTAAGATPNDAASCHASSLPAHSVAHGWAVRVKTPEAAVARTPWASATSAPQPSGHRPASTPSRHPLLRGHLRTRTAGTQGCPLPRAVPWQPKGRAPPGGSRP